MSWLFWLLFKFFKYLHVDFGKETSDLSDVDDWMVISYKESQIDLTKHFYDYINLQVPLKKVHPNDEYGKTTSSIMIC